MRRRRAPPGPFAELTRALKYRMTEWPPGPSVGALSRLALRRLLARHGLSRAELRLFDHHEAHAAAAAWAGGYRTLRRPDDRRRRRRLSSTISTFRDGRLDAWRRRRARSSLGVFFEHVTAC